MAEDHGMIKKVDLSDMYQESVGEQIYQKMLTDSQALLKTFPEVIKKGDKGVPNEIIIGEEGYCGACRQFMQEFELLEILELIAYLARESIIF